MAISVSIPTYNRRERVTKLVQSLVPQLHDEDEILIVDDGSPDETTQTISADPRVRYVRNPANLGMVKNWNEAIRLARNPWVCMIHDDDEIEAHGLETIRKVIEIVHEKPCVIAGGAVVPSDGQILRFQYCNPGPYAVLHAPQIPSGATVHKEVFESEGLFDVKWDFSPDLEFFPRLARSYPVVLIESPTVVRYQVHESNHQFETWKDPQFIAQLNKIVAIVAGYAGLIGQEHQDYVDLHMTGFLRYMMKLSRSRNDLEMFRSSSKFLVGRQNLGKRAWIMATMGSTFGWCPQWLAGRNV